KSPEASGFARLIRAAEPRPTLPPSVVYDFATMDLSLPGRLGDAATLDASLSDLARGVVGSEILRIAAEIRALKAKGATICNLTVGDFDPAQFPVPPQLLAGVRDALAAGHTNYPPSDGVLA